MDTNALREEVRQLLAELGLRPHEEIFARGRLLLLSFREQGGEQDSADSALNDLLQEPCMSVGQVDLLGDLLDCVHGWVGNPGWRIW